MTLLSTRRFLPLFITQFLGALNDNLLKNALVMLITYKLATETGENAQQLVTLAAGLFILPFFLFSATAGQLADKFDRSRITRIIKLAEILIMIAATLGFYLHSIWFLMFTLFAMGAHSTFFGPIKYALLPQHLRENELLTGNAYIEAGTFLAILIGTIMGGILILKGNGVFIVSSTLFFVALAGYTASRFIPQAIPPSPDLVINRNLWQETWRIVGYARANRSVFLSIMGISWFWLVGATYLSQFPTYAKDILHAEAEVVTLFLTIFSVGIGIGSFLCSKLLRGHIQSTFVPLAALGMTLFGIDLYFASASVHFTVQEKLLTFSQFTQAPAGWRILFDLLALSICAGLYIVPLYAIMQHRSDADQRARIIAANNVLNALFMVGAAIATMLMLKSGFTIPEIFLAIAAANAVVAIYICHLLPDGLLRSLARLLLTCCYRVRIQGMENYMAAGQRVLIVANHTSFLDAALIAAYLPEKITFAVNTYIASRWWMKPLLSLVDALPLDPTNPLATKTLIDTLKTDRKCMIFPEGRITITGALMKIYEGPGMIADKSGAKLLPIRIDGAQYSPFSRLRGKVRIRWFPRITLTILPPCEFHIPAEVKGRKRRQAASRQLYDVMSKMIFDTSRFEKTLMHSLIEAKAIHGSNHLIAEDIERKPLSYGQFIMRSFILGNLINRLIPREPTIALLLPNAVSTALSFFALQAYGKTPAMLNFTAGSSALQSACKAAKISHIITARRFIALGKLDPIIADLEKAGIEIHYLEEMRGKMTGMDKFCGLLAGLFPQLTYRLAAGKADAQKPAVILFTSGSEGTPKGVVLSHVNIQANRYQLSSRIDFGPQDTVFNCLPMFHSFGLTGGTLLPILSGIKTFYYPSPLHYRIVPELIYDTNATILFGTDTFLTGYAKFAHPYDFHSIRYVFAGAEKLKEETRKIYAEKYGVRIFEGYGATETAPVLSTNTPMQNRSGTVGRLMPALEHKLEPVPGITEGGKLWVKGPNVMLGYLRIESPGLLQPLAEGWYDTGDIVSLDEEHFVSIKGRTKRFAKIGGEMVSLTSVETAVNQLWPGFMHVAVTVPDEKKGEQIILLSSYTEATRDALAKHFKQQQLSELAIPRKIILVKEIPLLGTGKVDYQKAKALALEAS